MMKMLSEQGKGGRAMADGDYDRPVFVRRTDRHVCARLSQPGDRLANVQDDTHTGLPRLVDLWRGNARMPAAGKSRQPWTMKSCLLLTLGLAACAPSDPTSAVCTQPNIDNACTQPTTATRPAPDRWQVVLRLTITDVIEYRDGGVQCSYTSRRCVETECNYGGVPSMTMSQAIAACEDDYYGR